MRFHHWALTLACLMPLPANADIQLFGSVHHGDGVSNSFVPRDPIRRLEGRDNPTRFHLSSSFTLTAFVLQNGISVEHLDGLWLDGIYRTGTFNLSQNRFTLASPVTLGAGVHTLWVDPGCEDSSDDPTPCPGVDENDVGYSGILLVGTGTTESVNLIQRRHIGNNNFGNDGYGGRFYPDDPENFTTSPLASSITANFTTEFFRRLTEIRFYRVRDADAAAVGKARVYIDGVLQGHILNNGDPFVLSPGTGLAAGNHTLRVEAGFYDSAQTNLEDISWDDTILLLTYDPDAFRGPLNAIDPGQPAVDGKIRTKVAGSPFPLDLATLSDDGSTFEPNEKEKLVVELLDATDNSGSLVDHNCRTSWTVIQTVGTFKIKNNDNGRVTIPAVQLDQAVREVRVRMTETTGAATLRDRSCSTDAFAVRPADFLVQASDQTELLAGVARNLGAASFNANSTPTHRAGRPFTIRATARNALGATSTNYTGSPVATALGSTLGVVTGTASAVVWTSAAGVARTDAAQYREVGAFTLEVGDLQFAAIDAGDGSTVAQRKIAGTLNVGRFTPDHLAAVPNAAIFAPACGSFTYIGQPFRYQTAPVSTLTAMAAGTPATPTLNYTGALFKIPALAGVSTYTAAAGTMDTGSIAAPDAVRADTGGGTGTITFTLGAAPNGLRFTRDNATPVVPFAADIQISRTVTDSDGIGTLPSPLLFGVATAGNGVPFAAGSNELRYGHLRLLHGYGSERAPVAVPMRAEYWVNVGGDTGFVPNGDDSCTTVQAVDVTVTDRAPPPGGALASVTALAAGAGSLNITATARGQADVTVDLTASGVPWLLTDQNVDTVYAENPAAIVTFGTYSDNDRKIYSRETYR